MISESEDQKQITKAVDFRRYLSQINLPIPTSHKGQNGKLLVIGGSELFHSSIFWSADLASRIVDMVHLTSPANENNELFRFKLKQGFWNGIVVDWQEAEAYIEEDDVVLIGPGMERSEKTKQIVNDLVGRFGEQKWVIDGGALQMIKPQLLNKHHIITPHGKELATLFANLGDTDSEEGLNQLIKTGTTILSKGHKDIVHRVADKVEIEGGNAGLTKGGTGDVLAGLVASLYCKHEAMTSAVVGSLVTKKAGEDLWQERGPYFNTSDLVEQISDTLWLLLEELRLSR